jgi:hypothetical protein
MNPQAAMPILQALADGHDPYSGSPLPSTSPYQQADTVRALNAAIAALTPEIKKTSKSPPATNTGKPWSKEEDAQLLAAFDAHEAIQVIASRHARSALAITARLARFERVPMPAGVRGMAPAQIAAQS